jgi:hypothetical protein
MSIDKCMIVPLPKITDQRGNLAFAEGGVHVPFDIRRVYYLFDVPAGASRGGHGHKELSQLMIATSGSFDVILDDGFNRKRLTLSDPSEGLLICSMIWRELENFSGGSVCLVLASLPYNESDYFRNYEEFKRAAMRRINDTLS